MKNTSKHVKRLLSMVMVLAMILSMLPMTARAANHTGGRVYFETDWNTRCVQLMIGHSGWSQGYQMKKDAGNLYYVDVPTWSGAYDFAVFGTDSVWGGEGSSIAHRKAWAPKSTGVDNSGYQFKAGNKYLITSTGADNISVKVVYDVTVAATTNGTVTADKVLAADQETVTLTVTPDEGYELDSLSVKQGENDVPVTDNAFTMPAGNVTITASFKEKASYLYFVPGNQWGSDGARYAAYFFVDKTNTWADAVDSNGDGYYEVIIPEGGYTGVIFCRMNGSTTENTWDNRWNQTADLKIPQDGKNCFTMDNATQWSSGNGTWSVYTPGGSGEGEGGEGGGETTTTDYYLVGYINNADYNGQDYKFVDGKLTVTFANDSYVVVKDGSGDWYLCESYCTDTSAVLTKGNSEKMFVAAGTEWTFTLVENGDGTLTLSYAQSEGDEPADEVEYEATFHFANTVGWGTVNLYTWIGTGTTLTGAWPGNAVSQGEDGFYTATVTYTAAAGQGLNFIFNNGSVQTVDLSIPVSDFVNNKAEKWVILTTQTDGKYNADILDEAFRIVTSPVVDGTSVTFNYENAAASSVSLRGSMNDWGETAMEKDADGIWTVTLTDVAPGVYEYKFFVNGKDWMLDPLNTWVENENSAFIILDPNAKDTNSVTVNIHYTRADGNYDGWNFHLWNENGDIQDTSVLTEEGLVATLVFENARGVRSVNVIPRFSTADNKWAAQESTFAIDLSNIVSGTVDYYITSGSSNGRRALNTDVRLGNKLSGVELDYDTGKIHVTIAKPVVGAQFGIAEGDDPNTYTIYFQNNWLWSDIKAYYWGSAGTNPGWPGVAMTKVGNDGTHDIYMINVPVDVEGVIINGLKNDNSGNRDQTPDIKTGFADGLCYYMEWNNGNAVGTFVYDEPISITETTGSGAKYTLTLSEVLDLVKLHQYKVIFEGYEYDIDISGAYASDKFAEEFTYEGDDLGAIISDDKTSTTFKVWAPTAESVNILLYASGTKGTDDLIKSVPMTRDVNGTWVAIVEGNLNGTYYTYSVNVGGKTIEAVDPYARTTGVNGERGMVIDLDSTDPKNWASDKNPNPITSYTDAIIYELHVRDFSIDDSFGITDYAGKFLAFTQTGTTVNGVEGGLSTGIDYLKALGVTHVHLLPVYDYGSVDETTCSNFNWGYDPVNYNVPEGSYSTDPYKGEVRVEEFKRMIQALHEAGISVVMDVVYNHVYDAGKFGFNNIVPGYFSRPDSNTSGCGNDTASEREMVSKYIVDSVAYWTEEYHIDGFRFDLVGLIDIVTIGNIVTTVHEDLNRPDVIFYGEGWNMDSTNKEEGTEMAKQGNADKTPGFAYFSDSIRNQIAGDNGNTLGFVAGGAMGNLAAYFLAQPESWGATWTTNPSQVVQYASCHDNYTLIDKLIISTGAYGITDDIISMNNLAAAIYMTSQGIPFIHAGEEMLREKLEEDGGRCENSYNATDFVNSIKWDNLLTEEYADTLVYYQGLIAFRKAHKALRLNSADAVAQNVQAVKISDNVIAFLFDGNATGDDDIFVIFNANNYPASVTLPGGEWNVCVDGEDAGTATLYTRKGTIAVEGISAMILTREDKGKNETYGSSDSVDTVTLYFTDAQNWGEVYAYTWNPELAGWPGVKLESVGKNEYGQLVYSVEVSASADGLVFSNGSGIQTVDLTIGADGTGYYPDKVVGGKWECGTYVYKAYYLFGYINGANYACEEDAANMGEYQFVNGKLTATFTSDSYVAVKMHNNSAWYMTNGWLGEVTSATLYNTNSNIEANKLFVPGGVEVTFTLTENENDTLTLSYTTQTSGGAEPADGYYLFGWIDQENYGCKESYTVLGNYKFENGQITVEFEQDSYVGVKTGDNKTWYMTNGWLGNVNSAVLYNTEKLGTNANKLMIPGGVEVTLTLTKNEDGTLTLSYVTKDNAVKDETGIQNGATLHCWNWSFAQIEANMALIAEMGFTAIQTSPIQPLKEFTTDETDTVGGAWWLYYQPTGFVITSGEGNALGTKDELASMIETAHKYGIQVIVDVVANHLANKTGNDLSDAIDKKLLASEYWHDISQNITSNDYDAGNRYAITQHCMGGLPDLNTGNAEIQQFVLDFLKECIDVGVDGFRFDGAKHIETPDDDLSCRSDFWPFVIGGAESYALTKDKKDIYVYGEVLDGTNGYAISDYTEFMAVTDNSWGNTLRDNVNKSNAALVPGYDKPTDASNLVIWAESHDTYADGSSSGVSVENINKVWALIAARADAMGLYFARPNADDQLLGVGSVTGWYSEEVMAVNRFHKEFVGQGETLGNEKGISYVVRGDSGIVLVKVRDEADVSGAPDVSLKVEMADGTYEDQLTGEKFTVANGVLTGKIGETGIAVVYNACAHSNTELRNYAPHSCTEDGYTGDTYCKDCKSWIKAGQVDLAPGHSYDEHVTDPTCAADGYTEMVCSACDHRYKVEGSTKLATGKHTFGAWKTVKTATCNESGMRTRECAVCGASQTEMIPATGIHSYGAWTESKAPTCTAAGEKTRTCDCGAVETAVISALGHTEVIDAAVAATCTVAGKTEGKHCSACNEVLTAQEEISAKGHMEVSVAGKPATHTVDGLSEGKRCAICNEVLTAQEVIPASGHSFSDKWTVTKAATEAEAGEEMRMCSCGETETREIPVLPASNNASSVVIVVIGVAALGVIAAVAFVLLKKRF